MAGWADASTLFSVAASACPLVAAAVRVAGFAGVAGVAGRLVGGAGALAGAVAGADERAAGADEGVAGAARVAEPVAAVPEPVAGVAGVAGAPAAAAAAPSRPAPGGASGVLGWPSTRKRVWLRDKCMRCFSRLVNLSRSASSSRRSHATCRINKRTYIDR